MYPYKSFRIFTLDLSCKLYQEYIFQYNILIHYCVQVNSVVNMRRLIWVHYILKSRPSLQERICPELFSKVALRYEYNQTWPRGGIAKTPLRNFFWKIPPLRFEPGDPPSRRARLAGKFLGFFGIFPENSGNFR